MNQERPLILFDGVCNLCNASVNFVIDRDPESCFRFGALQSEEAQPIIEELGLTDESLNSIILVEEGKAYRRSTAALRIAKRLKAPWPLLYGFIVVPPFIRDAVYKWIARNRYKWFGKSDSCRMPSPELKERFLH